MGYVVFHMQKIHGTDSGTSAHIERKVKPSNADEERTYLNRRLIEYHDGVQLARRRFNTVWRPQDLPRKVGKNQVRAIRIMLSAVPTICSASCVRTFGRVVRRQHELPCRDVRQGGYRIGRPASGRNVAAYPRDTRAYHNDRTETQEAGGAGGQTLPHEIGGVDRAQSTYRKVRQRAQAVGGVLADKLPSQDIPLKELTETFITDYDLYLRSEGGLTPRASASTLSR